MSTFKLIFYKFAKNEIEYNNSDFFSIGAEKWLKMLDNKNVYYTIWLIFSFLLMPI